MPHPEGPAGCEELAFLKRTVGGEIELAVNEDHPAVNHQRGRVGELGAGALLDEARHHGHPACRREAREPRVVGRHGEIRHPGANTVAGQGQLEERENAGARRTRCFDRDDMLFEIGADIAGRTIDLRRGTSEHGSARYPHLRIAIRRQRAYRAHGEPAKQRIVLSRACDGTAIKGIGGTRSGPRGQPWA